MVSASAGEAVAVSDNAARHHSHEWMESTFSLYAHYCKSAVSPEIIPIIT